MILYKYSRHTTCCANCCTAAYMSALTGYEQTAPETCTNKTLPDRAVCNRAALGGSRRHGQRTPLVGHARRLQMHMQVAPQLSVHVNQMIAKAKHHWCNSRIDKCCSLRLIQRQSGQGLGLALALLVASLWLCDASSGYRTNPFSPAEQQLSLRLEQAFKPHQLLHSSRHHHGCR